jgi:hypothetical protein
MQRGISGSRRVACLLGGVVLLGGNILRVPALVASEPAADGKGADEEGFVSLFDGQSLAGWEIMNGGRFSAEDGVIKLRGGRGWLRSEKEYADFVLRLEVRWLREKQDSGIFLRASKEGANWPDRRYEVQCENTQRMARFFGASYQLDIELAQKLLRPVEQWNTLEIRCVGPNGEVRLNGQRVCTSSDLGKYRSGYIGLQGEGGELEFRNLRIRTLDSQP